MTEAKAFGGEAIGDASARQSPSSQPLQNRGTLQAARSRGAFSALKPLLGDRRRLVEESLRREVWGDEDGDLLNLAITLARLAAQRWVKSTS